MATLSFDGQSLILDGRRIWLVSGSIHYPRVPRELWHDRIRAARQAGLNCIDTYVFWNVHEPTPGRFRFEDDADLRAFVQLIEAEGMYCILRPGPYIDAACDFGGLPAWLIESGPRRLREHARAAPGYLEACSRYLSAVMAQVHDLQATSSGGGPIVLMQAENQWCCHHPEQAQAYLREITRYLRENGCGVPITVSNNLWQFLDNTIDTWAGNEHLAADLRQLRLVKPEAPPIVMGYWTGRPDHWGRPHQDPRDARRLLHGLAQVLAAGGQYNLEMFHGGTNFATMGGRSATGPDAFVTTSFDCAAPLREHGGRGPKYDAVKRISTFASQFGQVLAHLTAAPPHVAVAPNGADHALSVIHQRGAQGHLVMLLRSATDRTRSTELLLPNGETLPVPLGREGVAWLLLGTNLQGVAELTHANLCPWAFLGRRMLVLFGPAGADGLVSINGATIQVKVPTRREPLVQPFEQLTLVVLNEEQIDAACPDGERLLIGVDGLDARNQPVPRSGWHTMTTVELDGGLHSQASQLPRAPRAPRLARWQQVVPTGLLDGTSPSYRRIQEPAHLAALRAAGGYGWYRLTLAASGRERVLVAESADRLHFYRDGALERVVGVGPGARDGPQSPLGAGKTVVLADNLGRFSHGWRLGERKGLFGHVLAVRKIRLAAPKVLDMLAPDPAEVGGFFAGLRYGDHPPAQALAWRFRPSGRRPVVLDIQDLPVRVMILVNRKPLDMYDPAQSAGRGRWVLQVGEHITGGQNELRLARFDMHDGAALHGRHVNLYQCTATLSDGEPWAFAPWTLPTESAFEPLTTPGASLPTWFRCTFRASGASVPLWLEPRGMSKGQIYLNGRNVGRYFAATASGAAVGPQRLYHLPDPWLRAGEANVLMLFDEHGRRPGGCRLVYSRRDAFCR